MEVLQQLLRAEHLPHSQTEPLTMHLVSPLPERQSQATAQIMASFPPAPDTTVVAAANAAEITFDHCLFRKGHHAPASSYIFRSEATGSRTIVNHNDLPDMTTDEFLNVVEAFRGKGGRTWWHFEGRVPETTLSCILALRRALGDDVVTVSVEVERPGRAGLRELAAEADVVFYSKSWAEACGYTSADDCLREESLSLPRTSLAMVTWGAEGAWCISPKDRQLVKSPVETPVKQVVDSVGAGDTFVAGMLYGLICQADAWDVTHKLGFAVALATLKVQREGFGGLGDDIRKNTQRSR
ncbi:D-sorbose [Colletotrichum abscissum]|uniref:D-sorbose n=1 Tax=Colletotrichum abscissum TaxID=1671311 RepID=UPI0027D4E8F3|nr:D-sorbose [Colletotrichum abscissum]KAK1514879.1 D-sorbose [Colletotrichum abscissum]